MFIFSKAKKKILRISNFSNLKRLVNNFINKIANFSIYILIDSNLVKCFKHTVSITLLY